MRSRTTRSPSFGASHSASAEEEKTKQEQDQDAECERQLFKLAVASRLAVFVFVIVAGLLIPPYDTSAQLELTEVSMHQQSCTPGVVDRFVTRVLGPFRHWDGIYFGHIAEHGYDAAYPKLFAFFPLFPMVARYSSYAYYPLTYAEILCPRTTILFAGLLTNWICFIVSVTILYRLGVYVLGDRADGRRVAFLGAALFCGTPASVFMSAFYTESLFCLFSFLGLYSLHNRFHLDGSVIKGYRVSFSAGLCFFAAAATRSNGIVYAGFFLFSGYQSTKEAWFRTKTSGLGLGSWLASYAGFLSYLWLRIFAVCMVIALPSLVFEHYAVSKLCVAGSSFRELIACPEVALSDGRSVWQSIQTTLMQLPTVYRSVQHRFWGLGIFASYRFAQLPNFLMAAPALLLSISGLLTYFSQRRLKDHSTLSSFFHSNMKVYMFHWALLVIVSLTILHVPVSTRFLSTCPALYWYCAHLIIRGRGWLVYVFFGSYFVVGCVAFGTFFPWV